MAKYIIGLDVRTTAAKAILFSEDGMKIDQSREEYALLFPRPSWVEQNPNDLWEGSKRAVQQITNRLSPEQRKSIVALSISSQRDTLVPLDENGDALRNAITWMDSRSTNECQQLAESIGSDFVYETTGVPISTIWTGSFILWLRNNQPDIFDQVHCFGLVHDFILRQFGAEESFLDYSNACETMLFDIHQREWNQEILEAVGIPSPGLLPKLVASGTAIGHVSKRVAEEVGLSDRTLLVAGGGDQQCAALGAGAVRAGEIEIGIGTAANLLVVTDDKRLDDQRRLLCHEHVVPSCWVLEGALISAASTLSWFRDIGYSDMDHHVYEAIDREVQTLTQEGAGGVLMMPHFEGAGTPYWNPKARGLYLGLSLSTSKADLARAIMEGIAIEIGLSLRILREWGLPLQRAVITGGAGRSSNWAQIQANVYGIPTVLPKETDAAAVGAAILAGVGAEVYPDVHAGVSQLVKIDRVFDPQREKVKTYEALTQIQMRAYNCLLKEGIYEMLDEFREHLHARA